MGSDKTPEMELLAQLQGGGGEEAVDLQRILQLVLRNLWLIIAIVVIGTAATWVYVSRQPKIYASSATILVDQEEKTVIKFDEVQNATLQSQEFINTAVESFVSTKLLAKAVRSGGLDRNSGFMLPRQDGQEFNDIELANRLRLMVRASLRPNTRFIDITVEDTDPERAKLLATALVNEFIKEMVDQRDSASNYERDFLVQEAQRLKTQLENSEQELQGYREKHPDLSFEDNRNTTTDQLTDLNNRVTTAKAERLKIESALESLGNADTQNARQIDEIATLLDLPEVAKIREQRDDAQTKFAAVKIQYGPSNPKYTQAFEQKEEVERSLAEALAKGRETLRQRYQSAIETETKLGRALGEQKEKALEQDRLSIRYNVLSREVKSDRALYEDVITRLKEATVRNGVKQIPFHIMELPVASNQAIRPNPGKSMLFGFSVSLMLAVGLVVLIDRVFNTFRTADEVEAMLELYPLASIPESTPMGSGLVMQDDPHSAVAEAFRTMRAQLFLRKQDAGRKTFLFTSANPGEGKSFTAMNSAAAFAQQGLRTILIEADVRRPGITRQISPKNGKAKGLTDYLEGQAGLEEIVVETDVDNLWLLPAGTPKPNPSELLSKAAMAQLIETMDRTYDRVVIDTAPITPVSDTLLLARCVDAICLVIHAGKTPRQAVKRTLTTLRKAGGNNLAGFVLNRTARVFGKNQPYYYYDALLRR